RHGLQATPPVPAQHPRQRPATEAAVGVIDDAGVHDPCRSATSGEMPCFPGRRVCARGLPPTLALAGRLASRGWLGLLGGLAIPGRAGRERWFLGVDGPAG